MQERDTRDLARRIVRASHHTTQLSTAGSRAENTCGVKHFFRAMRSTCTLSSRRCNAVDHPTQETRHMTSLHWQRILVIVLTATTQHALASTLPSATSSTAVGYGAATTGGGSKAAVKVTTMAAMQSAIDAYDGTSGLVLNYTGTFNFATIPDPCTQWKKAAQIVEIKKKNNITDHRRQWLVGQLRHPHRRSVGERHRAEHDDRPAAGRQAMPTRSRSKACRPARRPTSGSTTTRSSHR